MEKVIEILDLTFKPTSTNKDKWIVESDDGNFSIWDGKLAEKLNKRINQKVSVEIRPKQEGTNYLPTITAMNDASDGTVKEDGECKKCFGAGCFACSKEANEEEKDLLSEKNRSILSQTMMKCYFYGNKAESLEAVKKVYDGFYEIL